MIIILLIIIGKRPHYKRDLYPFPMRDDVAGAGVVASAGAGAAAAFPYCPELCALVNFLI